jgi:hypothetical protein
MNEDATPEKQTEDQTAGVVTPALLDSLFVLALLVVTAVSCWLLYGPLIRLMLGFNQ